MIKLSICIPTFNRQKCLSELLDSIIDQGDIDVEIIVSDDCSSDDTLIVLESYKYRIKNLKIIKQNPKDALNNSPPIEVAGRYSEHP